ncbi:MAG TPA: cache domain-containing protein, partial [Burkholderiales bacterium]|nr:cache domain-containing protein [Burkholderiales bacterium]
MLSGVRLRLLLLVAACTIPMLCLLVYDAYRAAQEEMNSARADLIGRANGAARELGRDIQSAERLLTSMSRVPAIVGKDPNACAAQLALLASAYTSIGNAASLRPDGEVICSTAQPSPQPGAPRANVSDRDYFKRALLSTDRVRGDALLGRGRDASYVLPIAQAVRDAAGNPVAVLVVTLNLSHFAE